MIKTWDIFDTLIARRCIYPHAIFQIVEQVTNSVGFVQARILAERNASRYGNFNLDNIYEEFQLITNASKNICDTLKKLEYDIEFEQSIPITENIRQVKSGDILISDMYLPENFIRRLLDKAGLLVPVEIVITSNGKSSGRIWKQLAEQRKVLFHIGDNFGSDIKNPRFAGFESALTVLSNPTPVEEYILQKDFNFGAYLREIRLRNPFSEEIKRIYWQLFTLNIGILILLVQQIDELQKKCGFEYLGFCGRDTHYLRLLYEKYKRERGETPTPNDYLYYSRKLVRNSDKELAKYFSAKINNRKALMIDLIGTGVHLNILRKKYALNYAVLISIHNNEETTKRIYPNLYEARVWLPVAKESNTKNNNADFFIIELKENLNINDTIESLNRATHNSPIRLNALYVGEKIISNAVFSENDDIENFDVLENCLREVLKSKLVTSIYASVGGLELEEFLLLFLKALTTYSVSLPLRTKHQLIEQVDHQF